MIILSTWGKVYSFPSWSTPQLNLSEIAVDHYQDFDLLFLWLIFIALYPTLSHGSSSYWVHLTTAPPFGVKSDYQKLQSH